MSEDNNNKPSWKHRRRIIYTTLLFCMGCILYTMIFGEPNSLNEVIVMSSFGLGGSVIGAYVFGAVWDDKGR